MSGMSVYISVNDPSHHLSFVISRLNRHDGIYIILYKLPDKQ